ncbi:MAG TPA: group II truncated hemoglobin [Polyangiaceae bacterium]|nr:group II truncated hemoglobin [Polyangiaceae bacterium]
MPSRHAAAGEEPISSIVQKRGQFDRIGGKRGVRRLVRAFYRHMVNDPAAAELLQMHSDLASAEARLEMFLVEWLGGPRTYSQLRGNRRLRARHFAFRVGANERDVWLKCMLAALQETVQDAELRAELLTAFRTKAETIVNREN